MYAELKKFLDQLIEDSEEGIHFSGEDLKLSIAALYYRVILVDGRIREEETEHFRQILTETLEISEDELIPFEKKVQDLVKDQTSLAMLLKGIAKLPIEKRREILVRMQEISLSDQELHEFEINMVTATAELIGLRDEWEEKLASEKNKLS